MNGRKKPSEHSVHREWKVKDPEVDMGLISLKDRKQTIVATE